MNFLKEVHMSLGLLAEHAARRRKVGSVWQIRSKVLK